MPPLKNWYAAAVDELPLHIGRVACQRSNCWWDSRQRRRYATSVITMLVVVVIVILVPALRNRFSVEDFVLKVAAPLAPAFLLGIWQFREQMEAASRLDKLKEHSERLWDDTLSGLSVAEASAKARVLQDEIFENRRKSPLVFDWIYKRLQRDYELQMNHGVAELVADAKSRLALAQRSPHPPQ